MAGAAGQQHALRQRRTEMMRQHAGVETIRRGFETIRRRVEDGFGSVGAQSLFADLAGGQGLVQGGHGFAAVALDVEAGNDTDLLRHRFDVDTGDFGGGEQQAALGGVVAEFGTHPKNEVGFGKQLL